MKKNYISVLSLFLISNIALFTPATTEERKIEDISNKLEKAWINKKDL